MDSSHVIERCVGVIILGGDSVLLSMAARFNQALMLSLIVVFTVFAIGLQEGGGEEEETLKKIVVTSGEGKTEVHNFRQHYPWWD